MHSIWRQQRLSNFYHVACRSVGLSVRRRLLKAIFFVLNSLMEIHWVWHKLCFGSVKDNSLEASCSNTQNIPNFSHNSDFVKRALGMLVVCLSVWLLNSWEHPFFFLSFFLLLFACLLTASDAQRVRIWLSFHFNAAKLWHFGIYHGFFFPSDLLCPATVRKSNKTVIICTIWMATNLILQIYETTLKITMIDMKKYDFFFFFWKTNKQDSKFLLPYFTYPGQHSFAKHDYGWVASYLLVSKLHLTKYS